jgi:2-polyprenyl-3-methyl-5-hydroxy-6-metoxy-1,4-benzoquinol methylase
MDVQTHYKNHLSNFYSWMFGDFDEMVKKQNDFFIQHQIRPLSSKIAIDLGAGTGFQSMALNQLGFNVHAVDFSQELLSELIERNSDIKTYLGDIRDLSFAKNLSPELIVCMGDTLTHLSKTDEVISLIQDCHSILNTNGKVIFTFRNLSKPLSDCDRFIPVKNDENRILTCFLEDEIETVKVFDLLYERIDGKWNFKKSSYRKLKISAEWVKSEMEKIGFDVELSKLPNGMDAIIGLKTS